MVTESVFFASMMQYIAITGEQDPQKVFEVAAQTVQYCSMHFPELSPKLSDDEIENIIRAAWKKAQRLSKTEVANRIRSVSNCSTIEATLYVLRADELGVIKQEEQKGFGVYYTLVEKSVFNV